MSRSHRLFLVFNVALFVAAAVPAGAQLKGLLEQQAADDSPAAGSEGSIVADGAQIVEVTLDPVPLGDTAQAAAGGDSGGGDSGGGDSGGGDSGGGSGDSGGGSVDSGGIVIEPLVLPAFGYAWGNSPAAADYAPSAGYYHATGKGAGRIKRAGVGNYRLRLGGLGRSGGNVQVSAYGPGAGRCQVQSWSPSGTGLATTVRCSDHAGRPRDARYSALALWSLGTSKVGYVWANNATAASYAPLPAYAYNSTGGGVRVIRVGAGVYRVTFSKLGDAAQGGNVQVTSYGGNGQYCKVASWGSGGADFVANVRCFGASGRPADSRFSALVISVAQRSTTTAYAWVDNATAASSVPSGKYRYNSAGGGATVRRPKRGSYSVSFSKLGGRRGGNVQVSAYGPGSETCKVVSWNAAAAGFTANVSCWSASGQPADSRFSVLVLR